MMANKTTTSHHLSPQTQQGTKRSGAII